MIDASLNALAFNNSDFMWMEMKTNRFMPLAVTKWILLHDEPASSKTLFKKLLYSCVLLQLAVHHWKFFSFCVCYSGFFMQSTIILKSITILTMLLRHLKAHSENGRSTVASTLLLLRPASFAPATTCHEISWHINRVETVYSWLQLKTCNEKLKGLGESIHFWNGLSADRTEENTAEGLQKCRLNHFCGGPGAAPRTVRRDQTWSPESHHK